jgi:tetratricopeptide (TPR) repeat protein
MFNSASKTALDELDAALQARDAERFAAACRRYSPEFHRWYPDWMAEIEAAGDDARRTTLYAAARWVAEEKQDKSLLFTWFRPTAMDGTEDTLVSIDELEAEGAYDDAIATLVRSLQQQGLTDEGRASLALRLGSLQFGAGRIAEAEARFRESVLLARRSLELDMVAESETWLYELARWRGDVSSAAHHADRVAGAMRELERPEEARDWARRSTRVRQGEPAVRAVLKLRDGVQYEPEDAPLPLPDGAELVLVRNRPDFPPAKRALDEGARHLHCGRFKRAKRAFETAATHDPYDPEPSYQLGMMYLDADDMLSAARCFAKTESLGPGWRDVRAHAWLRDAIVERRAAPAVWRFRRALALGAGQDLTNVHQMGEDLATRWDVPPLWLDIGRIREWAGDTTGAAEAYKAGLTDKADPSTRTWLLVRYSQTLPGEAAKAMLRQAVLVNGDHLAVAEAKMRLAALSR